MNNINFFAGDKFPMYREALAKMQDMINLVSALAGLGGQNYILSGAEIDGDNVTSGIVVINGEVLPFVGGLPKERIAVIETRVDITALNVTYPEVYITRIAGFTETGGHRWADFDRIYTNAALYALIRDITGDSPGTVKMWAGQAVKIPADYRLCNGDLVAVSDYPELFDALGTTFGGDGVNSFALPDLRGRFVTGFDTSTTDYNQIGKTGGYREVTLTTGQLPAHDHRNAGDTVFDKLSACAADIDSSNTPSGTDGSQAATEYRVAGMTPAQWTHATIKSVGNNQAHENRPPYFTLAYIIKVR